MKNWIIIVITLLLTALYVMSVRQAETPTRSLWAAFPVKTISKYKHLNKNIHEKDDALDLWSLV